MPFKSKAQWRKCWAMKAKGQAGSWDCHEWADSTKTKYKNLPAEKSAIDRLACVNAHLTDITRIADASGLDPGYIFKVAFSVGVHPLAVAELLDEAPDKFAKLAHWGESNNVSTSVDIPKTNGSVTKNFHPQKASAPVANLKPAPKLGRIPLRRGLTGLMFGLGMGGLGSVLHSNSSYGSEGTPINANVSPTHNKIEAGPEKGVDLMKSLLGAGAVSLGALGIYNHLRSKRKEASAGVLTDSRLMVVAKAIHNRNVKQAAFEARNKFITVLDKQASLQPNIQAPMRNVQYQLACGRTLRDAVKIAYPHASGEVRGKIVEEIFKAAMIISKDQKKEPKVVTERKGFAKGNEMGSKIKSMC